MKYCIASLFIFCSTLMSAQSGKLSVEAHYPVAVGDNFINDNYKSIVDVGVRYRLKDLKLFTLEIAANGTMASYKVDNVFFPVFDAYADFRTTAYILQPKLLVAFHLNKISKLHPELGLGYSYVIFNTHFSSGPGTDDTTDSHGIDVNAGLSYDISKRFYVHVAYDFIRLSKVEPIVPDNAYNTTISLVKLGVGIHL